MRGIGRHIFYELYKVWGRRSFLLALAGVWVINVFSLWYGNLPGEDQPELSSYKSLAAELSKMEEEEKLSYLNERKAELEGIAHVQEILSFANWEDQEMADLLRESELEQHPGMFEEYFPLYQSGAYLCYTDSLEQERTLIQEVWEEAQTVYSYQEYLDRVRQNKTILSGISIFSSAETAEDFSSRNIEKSAEDYGRMEDVEISFFPEKGAASVLDNSLSDLLLVLIIFLLVGMTVYEEKAKQLFFVTRATKGGHGNAILVRLFVLLLSCIALSFVIYGSNFLFYGTMVGIGSLGRSIQSLACYQESVLHLSVGGYLLLGMLTKAAVGFGIGLLVLLLFIEAKHAAVPYLTGIAALGISVVLFLLVPAASKWNWIKYMNPVGLFQAERLYGGYTNLNAFGYPVSRLAASWWVLGIWMALGIFVGFAAFCRGRNLMLKRGKGLPRLPYREHSCLFLHEHYKIMVMNKAGVILLLFLALLGYQNLSRQYRITPSESYYRSMMQQLEGNLTEEKETLIRQEQERYEAAFARMERIEELVSCGEITKEEGESMKLPYYNEVAYYPTFQRVESQYEHVMETEGQFIYDTGYEYLLGYRENRFRLQFFLLVMGALFAFSNVYTMERQNASWRILSATLRGRRKISQCKVLVCVIWTLVVSLGNLLGYGYAILKAYPVSLLGSDIKNLPVYYEMPLSVPIWLWLGMLILLQAAVLSAITCVILWISGKVRTQLQALFLGACILLLPLLFTL